jgi:diguanylate cyclase (GGDEF)-like protein
MKILVVDDSIEKSKIIQRILEKNLPHEVETASTAEVGLDLLKFDQPSTEPCPYGIILMDIMLPGINGIEATRMLKEHPHFADVPILMITASTDEAFIDSAFRAGAMDYINTTPIRQLELLARVNSAIRLHNELERRKQREKELIETTRILNDTNQLLEKISSHDPLTNLFNRRYFDKYLESECLKVKLSREPLSLLMIDVDFFKKYNDEYGHQAGDTALQKVAETLGNSVARNRDIAARYGGEEFAIVLPNTPAAGAMNIAKKINKAIADLQIEHKHSPFQNYLTCSIGVATVQFDPDSLNKITPDLLIADADKALYKSKDKGRNQSNHYDTI